MLVVNLSAFPTMIVPAKKLVSETNAKTRAPVYVGLMLSARLTTTIRRVLALTATLEIRLDLAMTFQRLPVRKTNLMNPL